MNDYMGHKKLRMRWSNDHNTWIVRVPLWVDNKVVGLVERLLPVEYLSFEESFGETEEEAEAKLRIKHGVYG